MKNTHKTLEKHTINYPLENILPLEQALFLDIETTGFSAKTSQLYLIGCAYYANGNWHLRQWFAEKYEEEAYSLQNELGLTGFTFKVEDAANMSFSDSSFDTIIMNDAMEHVAEPEKVLNEVYRVLKPGGKLYVNFPPYNHPFGAHLSDVIGIPWVHLFYSDKTLISAYKKLIKGLPDEKDRLSFRISQNENGEEYFSYINKMTIPRFKKYVSETKFKCDYYAEIPLRKFLKPLSKIKFTKDCFTKMVVAVLSKD